MAAADFVMAEPSHKRKGLMRWLTTTDHKEIGLMYIWTGFVFFILGGIAALLMRLELFAPGLQFVSGERFNELFSLHGTTMVFLWIMPAVAGLGNYFVPIMLKAKDMAYPRVNALSFWLIVPAGILLYLPLLIQGWTAVNVTWVGYPRSRRRSPASASTCGSSRSSCWAWPPRWAPSTSSSPSSRCAARA